MLTHRVAALLLHTACAVGQKENDDAQNLYPRSGAGDEFRARGKAGRAMG